MGAKPDGPRPREEIAVLLEVYQSQLEG